MSTCILYVHLNREIIVNYECMHKNCLHGVLSL